MLLARSPTPLVPASLPPSLDLHVCLLLQGHQPSAKSPRLAQCDPALADCICRALFSSATPWGLRQTWSGGHSHLSAWVTGAGPGVGLQLAESSVSAGGCTHGFVQRSHAGDHLQALSLCFSVVSRLEAERGHCLRNGAALTGGPARWEPRPGTSRPCKAL